MSDGAADRAGDRPRCESCDYWLYMYGGHADEAGPTLAMGECHAHPPVATADGGSMFPATDQFEWCGEHPGSRNYLLEAAMTRMQDRG